MCISTTVDMRVCTCVPLSNQSVALMVLGRLSKTTESAIPLKSLQKMRLTQITTKKCTVLCLPFMGACVFIHAALVLRSCALHNSLAAPLSEMRMMMMGSLARITHPTSATLIGREHAGGPFDVERGSAQQRGHHRKL